VPKHRACPESTSVQVSVNFFDKYLSSASSIKILFNNLVLIIVRGFPL
jgi:hypothetical protein